MVALYQTQSTTPSLHIVETEMILPGQAPVHLERGNWQITAVKGDAWVFCADGDYVVHEGESIDIFDDTPLIRPLYIRTCLSFAAKPL